jgi:hypothetical protein
VILPIITAYEYKKIYERKDLYRQVEERNINNAIIFIKDATGVIYPMWPFDLTRNGITFDGDVLYARYREKEIMRLKKYFPKKKFYIYQREKQKARGELAPLKNHQNQTRTKNNPLSPDKNELKKRGLCCELFLYPSRSP